MKRLALMLGATILGALATKAQVVYGDDEKDYVASANRVGSLTTLTNNANGRISAESYKLSGIGDNWFATANFGVSTFLGHPKGCTDFFGRNQFTTMLSLGKWHSPYFGTRLTYQGFKFTNANLINQGYQNIHADLMFNVSSIFHTEHSVLSKWNVSPYIGGGVVRNKDIKKTLFGLSYGVTTSLRMTDRLHFNVDLGGTTTYQDFDGIGKKHHFGDNLLQGSIGFTVSIGKLGWEKKRNNNASLLPYPATINTDMSFPRNNYDGLNKLKERMANETRENKDTTNKSVNGIQLDAPILFFFKINSTTLVDKQQLVNIKEIAGAVKENNLKVKIIGAADSKTGTKKINRELSIRRCKYIAKLLHKAGVPKDRMTGISRGGINQYKPYTANRHACVIVYSE